MRISYPQFCAKGTVAFIAIFSFARRKPPSVFLRGAYPDLPLCIVYIADGIWLCADRVSELLRPVFSRGRAGISFMPRSARSQGLSCPLLPLSQKRRHNVPKTGPAGGADGQKMPSGSAFRAPENGQTAFFGCIYADASRSVVFFVMRSSKGLARVFFRRPMSEKSKNLPTMLITCPFFYLCFRKKLRRCTKTDAFCALQVPASVDFVDKICACIGHSAVQSRKTTKKANEPLQKAVSFVVKRRACRGRILRRSHIVAQKISAHIAQYAPVLRRRGKYCRALAYFRAHLTFNAVRPPVFLSFFLCKECASVNMPALFCHASASLPALICFFR